MNETSSRFSEASKMDFMAASHEDPTRPGALKKVLFSAANLPAGQLQMLNWAKIPAGKGFQRHYHEDMHEIFVLISGRAEMKVGAKSYTMQKGDSVLVSPGVVHEMNALDGQDVDYIVFGVSEGRSGKTVVLKD